MRARLAFALRRVADRLDRGLHQAFETCGRDAVAYDARRQAEDRQEDRQRLERLDSQVVVEIDPEVIIRAIKKRNRRKGLGDAGI